jgi:hypothetical protein
MSIESDRKALESYFLSNWNSTNCPVRIFNAPELIRGASTIKSEHGLEKWVRFTILPAITNQADMNVQPRKRTAGVLRINVFVQNKLGAQATASTLVDQVADLFYRKQIQHVQTRNTTYTFDGERDGWLQMTVTVNYTADSF